jgi:hypothetical protein
MANATPQPSRGTTIPKWETHRPVSGHTGIGSGPPGELTQIAGSAWRGQSRARTTAENSPLTTHLLASRTVTAPSKAAVAARGRRLRGAHDVPFFIASC